MKKETFETSKLKQADAMVFEEEEGSFFASSPIKKWGWLLTFENDMKVVYYGRAVKVGAHYKIFEDGRIYRTEDEER